MHNHDAKYPSRSGLEPGTPRLQSPVDTNKPSGPATQMESLDRFSDHCVPFSIFFYIYTYIQPPPPPLVSVFKNDSYLALVLQNLKKWSAVLFTLF